MQSYRHVPRVLQNDIRYVGVRQRLLLVALAVGTKPDVRFREYLPHERARIVLLTLDEPVTVDGLIFELVYSCNLFYEMNYW